MVSGSCPSFIHSFVRWFTHGHSYIRCCCFKGHSLEPFKLSLSRKAIRLSLTEGRRQPTLKYQLVWRVVEEDLLAF